MIWIRIEISDRIFENGNELARSIKGGGIS